MLPIIAVGAVLTGTLLVSAAASPSAGAASRAKPATKPPRPETEVSPAGYIVVPMMGPEKGQKAETVSLVELVGKLIF